jgi:HEAT repeat protein
LDKRIPPLEEIISRLLNTADNIFNSDLERLSNLNNKGLSDFKRHWVDSDPARRKHVISRLVEAGEQDATLDFTAVFNFGIEDADSAIRLIAIEGLELEDRYSYLLPLLKLMKYDESAHVRARSALALGKLSMQAILDELPEEIGKEIFAALLETLENIKEPVEVRRRALEAISPFCQEPVGSYIEDFYFSDDALYKARALFAMGRNCDPRWLKYLLEETRSSSAIFRYESARSLGEQGEVEGVPRLLGLLDDSDHEVQDAAILALGQIGGKEAHAALNKLAKSSDQRIKEAALAALSELLSCEDPLSLNY